MCFYCFVFLLLEKYKNESRCTIKIEREKVCTGGHFSWSKFNISFEQQNEIFSVLHSCTYIHMYILHLPNSRWFQWLLVSTCISSRYVHNKYEYFFQMFSIFGHNFRTSLEIVTRPSEHKSFHDSALIARSITSLSLCI